MKIERCVFIQRNGLQLCRRSIHSVLAALQQFVFCTDFFDLTDGVFTHEVFHHHNIARL